MDIADWRKHIDEIDRQLVALLNERARCAEAIGRLKRNTQMPVYEPEREKIIFENVQRANGGPLPDRELVRIYERLIDVMRKVQLVDTERAPEPQSGHTELEADINE